MNNNYLFNFKTDISSISIPEKLNNPFALDISEIAKIAAQEFQEFITQSMKAQMEQAEAAQEAGCNTAQKA